MLPGSTLLTDEGDAVAWAESVGYPVMLKSTAGGGGMGISICHSSDDVKEKFASLSSFSESTFKNAGMFVEKFLAVARHIEVQIFGDSTGNVVVIGERDCSLQRRNQKVVEETPAWGLSDAQRGSEVAGGLKYALYGMQLLFRFFYVLSLFCVACSRSLGICSALGCLCWISLCR